MSLNHLNVMDEFYPGQTILIPNSSYEQSETESEKLIPTTEEPGTDYYAVIGNTLKNIIQAFQQEQVHEEPIIEVQKPKKQPYKPKELPPLKIDSVMSPLQQNLLRKTLPYRYQNQSWRLVYSTREHGISMGTLYNNCEREEPLLFVIKTKDDCVFGAFTANPIKPRHSHYYGTGESYVFAFDYSDELETFHWTQTNKYFQYTGLNYIAFGGSSDETRTNNSSWAISIDSDLARGSSFACSTFGNEHSLYDDGNHFEIYAVEVWTIESVLNKNIKKKERFNVYEISEEFKNSQAIGKRTETI
jgi:hypothetical protein